MYILRGTVAIINSEIHSNTAGDVSSWRFEPSQTFFHRPAGAAYFGNHTRPPLTSPVCVLQGGGIYVTNGTVAIETSQIYSNHAYTVRRAQF